MEYKIIWQGSPICSIGIGLNKPFSLSYFSPEIQKIFDEATVIFYMQALEAVLPATVRDARFICLNTRNISYQISQSNGEKVVILVVGDPLLMPIGKELLNNFHAHDVLFYPCLSPIQQAFAYIKQPWDDIQIINLQEHPTQKMRALIRKNQWTVLILSPPQTPAYVANALSLLGFELNDLWIFKDIDAEHAWHEQTNLLTVLENDRYEQAADFMILNAKRTDDVFTERLGILDEHWITAENQVIQTPFHIRMLLLPQLALKRKEIGWVVGANVGEMVIEWARFCPNSIIHAVEYAKKKALSLTQNCHFFSVHQQIKLHIAAAPPILDNLTDTPQMIYLSIGAHDPRFEVILDVCWEKLGIGGKLVVLATTEETRIALFNYAKQIQPFAVMQAQAINQSTLHYQNEQRMMKHSPEYFIALWHKQFT